MHETCEAIREMVERDMREVAACGDICPEDYPKLKAMISSYQKLVEIGMMEEEKKMAEEGYLEGESRRVPRMDGTIRYSNYNPNRSPRTGRYTSNVSYHDHDGSIKADIDELMSRATSDHDRMLLMRIREKIDNQDHNK